MPTLAVPALSGTLYVQRNREVLAIGLATLAEQPLGITADTFHVSPDGQEIAFVVRGTLELADASGQGRHPLAEGVNGDLAWAPDSHAIAFVKAAGSTRWDCPPSAEIWVVELPAKEVRRMDAGRNPAWSPDSLGIAYVYGVAWAPDGYLLAVTYCFPQPVVYQQGNTEIHAHRCYEETGAGEVRLLDPRSGALSPPLVTGVDPHGDIARRCQAAFP